MSRHLWNFASENRAAFGVERMRRALSVSRTAPRGATLDSARGDGRATVSVSPGCASTTSSASSTLPAPHHRPRPGRGQGFGPDRPRLHRSEPNTKYGGDITYLPIGGGKFCYLAIVIDLTSRRLAGWATIGHSTLLGLSDRQAAEAVRCRIEFKYAMTMEPDDPGFHPSVVADFRVRLAGDDRADRLLDLALARPKEAGVTPQDTCAGAPPRQRADPDCRPRPG